MRYHGAIEPSEKGLPMALNIVCLDLEGVLIPEIWIAFAEASGILYVAPLDRVLVGYRTATLSIEALYPRGHGHLL